MLFSSQIILANVKKVYANLTVMSLKKTFGLDERM